MNKRSITEIDPTLHFVGTVQVTPSDGRDTRIGYMHRLFCLKSGRCRVRVRDNEIDLKNEDVLLVLSGTPYQILSQESGALLLLTNFNFFGESRGDAAPNFGYAIARDFRDEGRLERVDFSEGVLRTGYAHIRSASDLVSLLDALLGEAERGEILSERQISAYLLLCLNRIFRRLLLSPSGESETRHGEILAYLAQHFAEPIDNSSVARLFHYHPNYIGELVREATGLPLHKYLIRLRLRRASELLSAGGMPISEIARQSGFENAAYFTRCFRDSLGCTPSEYRRRADRLREI